MIMDRINFHEIIYNEGDFPFAFYFIVKGEVETFKKYC
jgi:CRP-like cAMP-binding protein